MALLIVICFLVHPELKADDSFRLNFGLSGSWVNPDSPGQGLFFDVNPETNLFWASWFTFGEAAPQATSVIGSADNQWFVALGSWTDESNEVILDLIKTEGGVFDGPMAVSESEVGSLILSFESCSAATLQFTFANDGPQGQFLVQRLTSTEVCEAFLNP